MSFKWAARLLTDPLVPMESSTWFATPLRYESPIETDAIACLADMRVTGPSGDAVALRKPPRTKKPKQKHGSGPVWDMLRGLDDINPPVPKSSAKPIGSGGRGKPMGDAAVLAMPHLKDGSIAEPVGDVFMERDDNDDSEEDECTCGRGVAIETDLLSLIVNASKVYVNLNGDGGTALCV
jgi:hypothetical protein